MKITLTAVFQKVPEGYIGYVEELPGANTQGDTLEEARENLKEAIELVLEANRELAEETLIGTDVIREPLLTYMEMASADAVREELLKKSQNIWDLVELHQRYEKRLAELSTQSYPNEDELIEETTLEKKKLSVKEEIYAIIQNDVVSH